MASVRTTTYEADGRSHGLDVFEPTVAGERRPGILFFHGGAWRFGERGQFHPQCEELAAAGYVAASATYSLDGTIDRCVRDAAAAFDALVGAATELGLDPDRLAVGGGSAGGHLAACLAACPDHRRPAAAAVLFNPVLDLVGTVGSDAAARQAGTEPDALSPITRPLDDLPPTIVFHGTADSLVPIDRTRAFRDRATAAGRICVLEEYEGREHAFFNPVPPELADAVNAGDFATTIGATRAFLDRHLAGVTTHRPA